MAIGSMTTNGTVSVIDKTLSISGAPADAAEVGKELDKRYTKGETYTREEIDQKLFYSAPNLLDNWYFVNPVNQRGYTGSSGKAQYTIDRWINGDVWTSGACAAQVYPGNFSYQQGLFQRLGYPLSRIAGMTVTGTVLYVDNTLVTDTLTLPSAIEANQQYNHIHADALVIRDLPGVGAEYFIQTANPVSVIAVKLEIGSRQTLAHQENGVWVLNEIPDYGEQLRKCQRYYYKCNQRQGPSWGYCTLETYVVGSIPFPVPMRTTPTITVIGCLNIRTQPVTVTSVTCNQYGIGFFNAPDATVGNAYSLQFEASAEL